MHRSPLTVALVAATACASGTSPAPAPSPAAPAREALPAASVDANPAPTAGPTPRSVADSGAPAATACGATRAQTEGRRCAIAGTDPCTFKEVVCTCAAEATPCQGAPSHVPIPVYGTWHCARRDEKPSLVAPRPCTLP